MRAHVSQRRQRRPDQRGAAAVEAALVICFVVIPLTFGIINYAYLLAFRQSLSQAAAEGARAAAVAPSGTTSTQLDSAYVDAVNSAVQSFGISCNANGLTCTRTVEGACGTDGTGASHDCDQVTLSYDYQHHPLLFGSFPGLGLFMPNTVSYSATAEVD